jgi:hypothetical protein
MEDNRGKTKEVRFLCPASCGNWVTTWRIIEERQKKSGFSVLQAGEIR